MPLVDPPRYDTYQDVHMRLSNSVVRYKGKPVVVAASPNENLNVRYRPLDNDLGASILRSAWREEVHSSDADLDISSPPLGYANYKGHTYYLQRYPVRKQHQGIHPSCVMHYYETKVPGHPHPSCEQIVYSRPLAETIEGQYAKGIVVLENMLKDKSIFSQAFHRKYALVKDEIGIIKLKHMTKTIGWVQPGTDVCVIPEELSNDIFFKDLKNHGFVLKG